VEGLHQLVHPETPPAWTQPPTVLPQKPAARWPFLLIGVLIGSLVGAGAAVGITMVVMQDDNRLTANCNDALFYATEVIGTTKDLLDADMRYEEAPVDSVEETIALADWNRISDELADHIVAYDDADAACFEDVGG
jgi:hypothetical protein